MKKIAEAESTMTPLFLVVECFFVDKAWAM